MANDTKFFDGLIRAINANIAVMQMCRVIDYDTSEKNCLSSAVSAKSKWFKKKG